MRRACCIRCCRRIERYGPGGVQLDARDSEKERRKKEEQECLRQRQMLWLKFVITPILVDKIFYVRQKVQGLKILKFVSARCIQKIARGKFKWEAKKKANAMMRRYVLRRVLGETKYLQHNQRYLPLQSIENSAFMIAHVRSHKAYTLILKHTHTHTHTHTHIHTHTHTQSCDGRSCRMKQWTEWCSSSGINTHIVVYMCRM